jgi:hypothetical protein
VIFRFACPVCDIPLEADTSQCGADTACPTCGQGFGIPQYRDGALLWDPKRTPPRPKESMAYLHAYAFAGKDAPTVVRDKDGRPSIRCRRCRTINGPTALWCSSCRSPFAIESGQSFAAGGTGPAGCLTALAYLVLAVFGLFLAMCLLTGLLRGC